MKFDTLEDLDVRWI